MIKRVKYLIRNYFGFSRSETNGFFVLLIIMLVFLVGFPLYTQFTLTASYSKAAEDKLLLDSLVRYFDENSVFSGGDHKEQIPATQKEYALFGFDPNKID